MKVETCVEKYAIKCHLHLMGYIDKKIAWHYYLIDHRIPSIPNTEPQSHFVSPRFYFLLWIWNMKYSCNWHWIFVSSTTIQFKYIHCLTIGIWKCGVCSIEKQFSLGIWHIRRLMDLKLEFEYWKQMSKVEIWPVKLDCYHWQY